MKRCLYECKKCSHNFMIRHVTERWLLTVFDSRGKMTISHQMTPMGCFRSVPDEPYSCSYVLRMVLSKNWQKYHQFGKNWNNFGDFSDNSAVLHVTTKLVTAQWTLNMQHTLIIFPNETTQNFTLMGHSETQAKIDI